MQAMTRRGALFWLGAATVAGVGAQPPAASAPKGAVVLEVSGDIASASNVIFDAAMLDSFPEHTLQANTPWFQGMQTFSGPRLGDVLQAAGVKGSRLKMVALNDYAVEVPRGDVALYQPVLARKINGKILSIREKGPLFLMYPFKEFSELRNDVYYARCIWQVNRIVVL